MTKTALISKNSTVIANSILFTLIGLVYYIAIPESYAYNSDLVSRYGMALAEGFLEIPDEIFERKQWGYVNNGQFSAYTNWPPGCFVLLAIWMKLFGSGLLQARIFMALVSLCTVFFFNQITKALQLTVKQQLLSTLLFAILPYHLTLSSLIYADIWVSFFWSLFIWFYLKGYGRSSLLPIALLGLLFSWIIPVIGLAFLLYEWNLKNQFSPKFLLRCFIVSTLALWLLILGLKHLYSNSILLNELYNYSIWRIWERPVVYSLRTIKTVILVLLESVSILSLYLLNRKVFRMKLIPIQLNHAISILLLTTTIYTLILPAWVVAHKQYIMFFDIIIVLVFIALIRQIPDSKQIKQGIFALVISVLAYFILQQLSFSRNKNSAFIAQTDAQIVEFINANKQTKNEKICIFYHLSDKEISKKFVVRNQCNAYLFEKVPSTISLLEYFNNSAINMKKIKLRTKVNYDFAYLITEEQELDLPKELIVISTEIENLNVYKLNWR